MRRLLIFLVLVVLIEFVLPWALAHYGLIVLGAMQLVDVEPVAGAPPCVAPPPQSVAPGGVSSSGGGASRSPCAPGSLLVLAVSDTISPGGPVTVMALTAVALQAASTRFSDV